MVPIFGTSTIADLQAELEKRLGNQGLKRKVEHLRLSDQVCVCEGVSARARGVSACVFVSVQVHIRACKSL